MKYLSIPTPGGTASGRERLVDIIIKSSIPKLREKLLEALQAVLPIAAIVLVLCFSIAPVSPSILLCFLLGAAMIIVGIMFFTLGAEMSMTPMGERVGSMLTRSQNLFLIIGVGFLLGFLITISEPDLQVLANQVPSIPNMTLILSVATGVGIFLVMAFLRMLLGIPLPRLLVIFYAAIFLLAAFVPKEFLAVAFDSGGVTTGPMTVPFIMALGVGVSAIRSDRHAADDSFGLVALCSVGPILAVLILGIVFNASESSYVPPIIPEVGDSVELWQLFSEGLPTYLHEIATSLLPIVVMFGIFQLAALHIDRRTLGRIGVGLVYTYIGLVLFLTGANIGFMPAGNYLGQVLGGQSSRWLLIPIGMLIGYFIVRAEPAVYVLNKQVEEVTDGAISAGTMGAALSAGVALSVGLAMVRVLTGISILWFLIPGYLFAISISFVVPKLYTAIDKYNNSIQTDFGTQVDAAANLIKQVGYLENVPTEALQDARVALEVWNNTAADPAAQYNANRDLYNAVDALYAAVNNKVDASTQQAINNQYNAFVSAQATIERAAAAYNQSVESYETTTAQFPANVISGIWGVREISQFAPQ